MTDLLDDRLVNRAPYLRVYEQSPEERDAIAAAARQLAPAIEQSARDDLERERKSGGNPNAGH